MYNVQVLQLFAEPVVCVCACDVYGVVYMWQVLLTSIQDLLYLRIRLGRYGISLVSPA